MRIISANVNGIRSAARKGFLPWLAIQQADVICIQETKAQEHQLSQEEHYPEGYHCYYFDALKKGYSGVAIYAKKQPDRVIKGLGEGFEDMDAEGRFIQADFGNLSIISLYLPSGSSGDERQQVKFSFMERFTKRLRAMEEDGRDYVICGDWNIVHKEIDIKNWKGNQKNSGCLPEERAWLDLLFDEIGLIDGFREIDSRAERYTWWSNRGQAWANNTGWRIDYQILSSSMRGTVVAADIYRDERFSDHAPLTLDYDYSF